MPALNPSALPVFSPSNHNRENNGPYVVLAYPNLNLLAPEITTLPDLGIPDLKRKKVSKLYIILSANPPPKQESTIIHVFFEFN